MNTEQFSLSCEHGTFKSLDDLASFLMTKQEKSIKDLRHYKKTIDDKELCSICLKTIKINNEIIELECKHYFHAKCIYKWLRKHSTCPICRENAFK